MKKMFDVKKSCLSLILVFVLCFCLLLCACTGDEMPDGQSAESNDAEQVRVLTALVDREDGTVEYIDSIRSYEVMKPESPINLGGGSYGMSDGYYYVMALNVLHRIDGEGKVSSAPIPVVNNCHAVIAVRLPNDTLMVVYTNDARRDGFVCLFDSEGTQLAQTDLPEGCSYNYVNYDAEVEVTEGGDYRVILNLTPMVVVLDEACNLVHSIALFDNADPRIFKMDDIYYVGDYDNILYALDFDGETYHETDAYPFSASVWISQMHVDPEGDAYYDTELGVFCEGTGGVHETVLEWLNGAAVEAELLHVSDRDTLFVSLGNMLEENELAIIDCSGEQALQQRRRLIRIGYLDITMNAILEQAISTFNAENDTYYISLVNYGGLGKEERTSVLEADLLSGNMPDMLYYSGYNDLAFLYDKGVLVDLLPFYGDRLLGGVKSAMMQDGHLWSVPFTMTVRTYTALQSVIDGALTWEDFYALTEGLSGKGDMPEFSAEDADPQYQLVMVDGKMMLQLVDPSSNDDMPFEGEVITGSHDSIRHLYENGLYDFVDYENKTASFDSAEFCSFIENLKRIDEEYVHKNAGNILGSGSFRYEASSAYLRDNIVGGHLKLLYTYMGDIGVYPALKHLLGDNAIVLCGYPSVKGAGAKITTGGRIAVSVDSAVHGGCRAFIDYMLSDAIQSADVVIKNNLPVTADALSAAIDTYRYFYYPVYGETMLIPAAVSAEPLSEYEEQIAHGLYTEVVITEEDKAAMMEFFETCHMEADFDPVIKQIVEEELSFWQGNARTLEETAKIIQSRVWIYLNE